jgi:predicted phage terminase large subunit-like protein
MPTTVQYIRAQCRDPKFVWVHGELRRSGCGRCPQERALLSPADILVMGGSAGGGKTYALLLGPLQWVGRARDFSAVIFRRIMPSVTNAGGMWDQSYDLYPHAGGVPIENPHMWTFPDGSTIRFSHLQHEKDKLSHAGAQVPLLEFDQLEEFEESQFWYLWSRARSACRVRVDLIDPATGLPTGKWKWGAMRPYVRASANPVPADDPVGGWVHRMLQWWIDPSTGLAIPERSGVMRYAVRGINDQLAWYDSLADAALAHPGAKRPQSITFLRMALVDNPILEQQDPDYRAKLELLPLVERERLLGGNWNVKPSAGFVFNRAWFKPLDAEPVGGAVVRYFDKAGTEKAGTNDPDWTAGVKMRRLSDGRVVVSHVISGRWSSLERNRVIRQIAEADGRHVPIVVEQEPGSGGKESAEITIRELAGWDVRADRVTGDRIARMGPLSAQAEAGNVYYVRGEWNESFLQELHSVPHGRHDDQATAAAGAFNTLTLEHGRGGRIKLTGY